MLHTNKNVKTNLQVLKKLFFLSLARSQKYKIMKKVKIANSIRGIERNARGYGVNRIPSYEVNKAYY